MKRRLRVYVAGAYSADNVVGVLLNMKRGMHLAARIWTKGFAPFVPWHDFLNLWMAPEHCEPTVPDFADASMVWLEVSDAVLITPKSENSKGTKAEIGRAHELGIPVFYTVSELAEWAMKHGA